ncbi:MAG: histidine ammonia-lyase [Pseudomonadota bacterium]
MKKVLIGKQISVEDVYLVSSDRTTSVEIDKNAIKKIKDSRSKIDDVLKNDKVVYGVNTGFGSLSGVRIDNTKSKQLQSNYIRSHSAGVGTPLEEEFVRAIMFLRAQNLSLGYSGVRQEVIDALLCFLEHNIIPVIPEKGSVGASGDLAPLAHLALCLMGEGEVIYKGQTKNTKEVLSSLNIKPLQLEAKEGLALTNGTQFMTGLCSLALIEAENLLKHADVISALSVEAVEGTFASFDIRISNVRPHKGQSVVSKNMLYLSSGSEISKSHKNCDKVQDPYSFRCVPQVHGAVRDTLSYLRNVLSIEINSVTDNPLIFDDAIISGGNFHGEPIAFAADFASIALTDLSSISERRIDKILTPQFSAGLPAYLAKEGGLNSGFMIAQYTAAALLNENRVLAHPSSIDNVPTSNNKEDHVSMGATGARKLLQIVENLTSVLAIELMVAVEGCAQRAPLKTSAPLRKVMERVRKEVPPLKEDRVLSGDIAKLTSLIKSRELLEGLEVE